MISKVITNETNNETPIIVDSLSDFIQAISIVTKGTELYKQVIEQFIQNINNCSDKNKAWEYYTLTFLSNASRSIFFTLSNFIGKIAQKQCKELIDLHTSIHNAVEKNFSNAEIILKNFSHISSHSAEQLLFDYNISEEKKILPMQVYYRGESSKNWKTLPSVMRDDQLFSRESFFYHEIQVRSPKEFEHLTHLSKLATMQHFNVPTRLLDITSNPLNALYFACEGDDQIEQDGKVMFFPTMQGSMSYSDSDKALVLSSLAPLSHYEKFNIEQEIRKSTKDAYTDDSTSPFLNKLFLEICTEKPAFQRRIKFGDILNPLFVQPNMTNPRIANQQGAFLLSGLSFDRDEAEKRIKDFISPIHIIIPANRKNFILKELNSIGINQATIYPNIDKIAEYLKRL